MVINDVAEKACIMYEIVSWIPAS